MKILLAFSTNSYRTENSFQLLINGTIHKVILLNLCFQNNAFDFLSDLLFSLSLSYLVLCFGVPILVLKPILGLTRRMLKIDAIISGGLK